MSINTKRGEKAMNKINGYTQDEAENLVEYIYSGRQSGKTLSYLFDTYGKSHGRAKGSVRNYYYALLKSKGDIRVQKLLKGKDLTACEIKEFTESETDEVINNILIERSKGYSVRRAIKNIAGDDEKLVLRLQNKYRNILKKQPDRIERAIEKLGLSRDGALETDKRVLLKSKIEREINTLYDKINSALKAEVERLREENGELRKRLEDMGKNDGIKY